MRKFATPILAAFVFIATASAQTVVPHPDPGIKGEGYVTYVGRYGERFKLRGGWTIDPSMNGDMEVINFYPFFRPDSDKLVRFKPEASDFKPENFTKLALIQLVITPWKSASSKSLEELRKLKEEDLKASGVEYRILDDPFVGYGHVDQKWPKGTFEVLIASPYFLTQLYTGSEEHLAILTAGRDTPPSTFIASHYNGMRAGLREWIVPSWKHLAPPPSKIIEGGLALPHYARRFIRGWVVIGAIFALVWITGPAWVAGPAAALLIYSHIGLLLGGFIGLLCWPFVWSHRYMGMPAAIAVVLLPIVVYYVERRRGRSATRRKLIGTAVGTTIVSLIMAALSLGIDGGPSFAPYVPVDAAVRVSVVCAMAGLCVGVGGISA